MKATFAAILFLLTGFAAARADDDATIARRLPADHRAYAVIAARDGSVHRLTDPDTLARSPRVRFVGAPSPTLALAVATAVPSVVAPPRIAYAEPAPAAPPELAAKPVAEPSHSGPDAPATVAGDTDLAWLFAHRFDDDASSVAEDAVPAPVPGEPVRAQVSSPFDIRSGAFHGVRAVNGFSAARAAVAIPCGISHFALSAERYDQETGYVYIGGWGAGPRGAGVDAGLQKSSAQSLRDDYAFYFKYDRNAPITSDMRFPCGGPDVVLELYPMSPTALVFSATGVNEDGRRVTIAIVQRTLNRDGWVPDGGGRDDGVILKRVVSIAQPAAWRDGANPRRYSDGSYFGITGPSDPTPRLVWRDCEVGRVTPPNAVPYFAPWDAATTWTPNVPGVYLDFPPTSVFVAPGGACDAAGILLQ